MVDRGMIKSLLSMMNNPLDRLMYTCWDLTKMDFDCIVNVASKSLLGGDGVDGAIHRTAEPCLLEECRTLHGCNIGEAKITQGYDLSVEYVIHTAGPIYSGVSKDEGDLFNCYWNSLELAKNK